MPLFLNEEEVVGLIDMPEAMEAIEGAFRALGDDAGTANHPRARLYFPAGVLQHMAAALPARGVMGTKTYSVVNGRARFYVQLFSTETGELLAYMEADKLGQMRTGAATGVAAKYMARAEAKTAAILGSGWQAESQVAAVLTARPAIETFHVYSRSADRREQFCAKMAERHGISFLPDGAVDEAVRDADIIVCVSGAATPILLGNMLSAGQFVSAVGANRLTAREIDEDVVGRAGIVAVDDLAQARVESAELIFASERRKSNWSRIHPLAEIVSGRMNGRESEEQITLFKSLGIALEDVAVAARIYDKARALHVGRGL